LLGEIIGNRLCISWRAYIDNDPITLVLIPKGLLNYARQRGRGFVWRLFEKQRLHGGETTLNLRFRFIVLAQSEWNAGMRFSPLRRRKFEDLQGARFLAIALPLRTDEFSECWR
jgi:hypothetical protein